MRILVTGAAGFIGSHLSEELARDGHEVVGVDNFSDFYARGLKELNVKDIKTAGVNFVEGDLAKDDLTKIISRETEIIFHLAAQPGLSPTTTFQTYLVNNVISTFKLLEAVKTGTKLKLFVYISTSSVYGAYATAQEDSLPQPISDYGVTKLAAEQLALSYSRRGSVPVTALRIFSVYGERERPEKLYPTLIRSILSGQPFPLYQGSLQHERSFTYIGDIVDGLTLVLQHIDKCWG